jgi:hypothetical protein
MIAAALTVINPRILLRLRVKFKALLEVFDRLHIPARFQLRDASAIKCLCKGRLDINGRIKVIDSELVIAHVLVDETTSDIDILIFWHLHKHAAQALKGFVKTIESVI